MRPSSPTLHGALRGVLVNPWFAAGAGLVIAASMWLYAPQTQLSFPHEAIGRTKCQVQGCAPMAKAPDAGSVATSSGQPIPSVTRPARRRATADVQTKSGSSALAFGYSVVSRHRRRFRLELTVTSKKPITNWTLSFTMDGDRIRSVVGANWQPAGSDSGAASGRVSAGGGYPGGGGQGGGGQGGGGQGGGGQGGGGYGGGGYGGDRASHSAGPAASSDQQFSISFIVVGTGPLVAPSNCFFNGASCTFSSAAG